MLKNYKIAIFPGSFNVFHQGHISVLKKAYNLFETIYLVISNNSEKNMIDMETRYNNIINNNFVKNHKKINVIKNNGLTIDILHKFNCYYIIRGVRDEIDFMYEQKLYDSYKSQSSDFEIIYFLSDLSLRDISSHQILNRGFKNYEK